MIEKSIFKDGANKNLTHPRNEQGITLIALIITTVVLLILAIVAIGQAQESDIVGYAQNASSKYVEAQTNEIDLLSTYETTLETLAAEKIVLELPGINAKYTILPSKQSFMVEGEESDGEKVSFTGKFTIEPLTQQLINDLAVDEMPTSVDSYLCAICLKFDDNKSGIILVTQDNKFYAGGDGSRFNVISYTVSEDTLKETIEKYTNTIGE